MEKVNLTDFTNLYPLSKTLRFKLVPIGATEKNLKTSGILDGDFKRAGAYAQVKNLIDSYHKAFIEDVLSKAELEWGKLYEQFDLYQKESNKEKKRKQRKEMEAQQKRMRQAISGLFKKDKRYEKLFKKELLTELLPSIIKDDESGTITDKKAALDAFNRFATYFKGFHENRENLYKDEQKATAISNRVVNENFPRFYANVKVYEYLNSAFPQIIEDTENSLSDFLKGVKLSEIFNKDSFNAVLSQSGIDFYNTIISGISEEGQKVQGLNEKINLASQKLPAEDKAKLRKKMVLLYKQILSDKNTASFIPAGFEKSEEVYDAVRQFKEQGVDKYIDKIEKLFAAYNDYDLNGIVVPAKERTAFSSLIFGKWSVLNDGLLLLEQGNAKKEFSEKQTETMIKRISERDYSLAELQKAYELWAKENGVIADETVKKYFSLSDLRNVVSGENHTVTIIDKIKEAYTEIDFENQVNLQAEPEAATSIKSFLDEVQNLYHYLKIVDYHGEEQKDSIFYSEFDGIISGLSDIVPLYNKVRNFVTKKPGEVKKVKLNFECPTLADGWDLNKESSNDAIILRKGWKYYLGILNPNSKPKIICDDMIDGEAYYDKMIYKLLPGPNKMLPKVFFSVKGQERFCPPDDLLFGYEQGKHKKGKNFDEEFMRKLIDWFKTAINRHDDWKNFNFNFSPTDTYEDLSGFYKEIELQGYKISFQKISERYINSLVDSGKLYLFQIYNKDFAEKSTGRKNLHTLYWENLFSEENLRNVCLKLNGEAELFFRPKSESIREIKHEKGSILVNKTTSDGKSIPEETYQEIYKFKNGIITSISATAQKWLESGKVVCKEATHTIVKDKHFTKDTYLFHCPITMNFKAGDITGKKFNEKVLDYLRENPDVKIIGLDRGERHLIYLSLINQKGEIELQKTLNLVDHVRSDKTVSVNYQEKLVQKEGDRDKARKNWQTIGNIKELKEGYLSNVIHEIAKLMIENNAIIVMEDLNFGFKRGRFPVERQVYQKFENMLIEKLNYLVFKDNSVTEPGGVLNAYQLADKSSKVSDVGKQCGWIFYIPASYTSKIDPVTGFVNMFDTQYVSVEKSREFFGKFENIKYNADKDYFEFVFDYKNFTKNRMDSRKKWTVCSYGKRIETFRNPEKNSQWDNREIDLTEELKKLFDENDIDINGDLKSLISEMDDRAFFYNDNKKQNGPKGLLQLFRLVLQMRNSVPNTDTDYLISPVADHRGIFYDSRNCDESLPENADANGAYNIARKGLWAVMQIKQSGSDKPKLAISNEEWLKFAQEKPYEQKQ